MSFYSVLLWLLSLVGISNGPCGPTSLSREMRDAGADQCKAPQPSSSHARTSEDVNDLKSATGSNVAETGPTDDISNGF